VAHTASPSLNTDDSIAAGEHTELDGVEDTPCKAAIDVLLPGCLVEVGLLLVKEEGVDAAVEMGVLGALVSG
jgi:hypothetical protein